MNLPQINDRQLVYKNDHQLVYRVDADFGDFTKQYFVNDTGERAGIVAARDGSILLVRQYRLLINELSWEIPGGKVDPGETPETAAVRECLEETGVRCFNPRPLVSYHAGLDTRYNPTHLFYSEDPAPDTELQAIHTQEVSSSTWVPLEECVKMIANQKIVDSFTIIAVLAYLNPNSRNGADILSIPSGGWVPPTLGSRTEPSP